MEGEFTGNHFSYMVLFHQLKGFRFVIETSICGGISRLAMFCTGVYSSISYISVISGLYPNNIPLNVKHTPSGS